MQEELEAPISRARKLVSARVAFAGDEDQVAAAPLFRLIGKGVQDAQNAPVSGENT
jgi:hypothetical protein